MTAVAEGEAIITATCGAVSATCTVKVNAQDDEDSEVRYFDLNGLEVHGTPTPGIYIRVIGNKADKVVI